MSSRGILGFCFCFSCRSRLCSSVHCTRVVGLPVARQGGSWGRERVVQNEKGGKGSGQMGKWRLNLQSKSNNNGCRFELASPFSLARFFSLCVTLSLCLLPYRTFVMAAERRALGDVNGNAANLQGSPCTPVVRSLRGERAASRRRSTRKEENA